MMLATLLLLVVQADPVAALDAELKAASSATAVLQKRCPEPIRAVLDPAASKTDTPDIRVRLGVSMVERVFYREVRLMCGDRVFSRAGNWYLPGRLTPAMNRQLMMTDTPFGVVIRDYAPTRRTFQAERIETGGVLRHHALVIGAQNRTLAMVVETYTAEAAAAPPN
jgi:chorismate-pyruvate lyase